MDMAHMVTVIFPGNERGGAATHLSALATAVVNGQHESEVTWVSIGRGPLSDKIEQVNSLHVEVLPGSPRAAFRVLVNRMRESSPDILWHSNGPRLNVLTAIAARRAGRRWITTIHSDVRKDFLSSRVKSLVFTRLHRMALRTCAGGFIGNPSFEHYLPGKPTFYVPNAVNPTPLTHAKDGYQQQMKEKLGIPVHAKLMGMAVRFDPVKDIPTVLQAFSQLNVPNVHLLIAGDGAERVNLEHMARQLGIADKTHFLGFLDDVIPFYAALDIHVLASKSEGASPFAILEAGSCDTVNVGSDIPGIRNLLHPGETGMCFPVGNADALANVIQSLFEHEELRGKLVQNFRGQVLPRFTEQHMMTTYMCGYQSLMKP